MARIAGITIERNAYGKARYVRIDLKRYADELFPFLQTVGMESEVSAYNKDFIEKMKRGEQAIKEGKTYKVDLDNIWK